jgi:uncharacterized membrane protein HdeD (DUF308 family)
MRILIRIIGILLVILGAVWVLQGVDVLPGSVMTGDVHWAIYGAIAIVVGIILIAASSRRKAKPPLPPPPETPATP